MLPLRLIAALACAVLFSGCATHAVSLQEVRQFASASGKLAGFADLSTRFRTTYQRESPYLRPRPTSWRARTMRAAPPCTRTS